MAGFSRRSKPLKATALVGELEGVTLSGLADGDLLVYDSSSASFINDTTLPASYVIGGALSVATLTSSGNVSLGGTLGVATNLTVGGTLGVNGASTLQALSLTTLNASGAATLASTLNVGGTITGVSAALSNDLSIADDLTVSGDTALGPLTATTGAFSGALSAGPTTVGGALSVAGDAAIFGGVMVSSSLIAATIGASGLITGAGGIDFVQTQAYQMRLENRTADPTSPLAGQVWLRTDL